MKPASRTTRGPQSASQPDRRRLAGISDRRRLAGMPGIVTALLLTMTLLAPAAATAAEPAAGVWTVLPFTTRGVDADSAATFRDLLQSELAGWTGAPFLGGGQPCDDAPCALAEGDRLSADWVVYGALSRLGESIVVTGTLVDVAAGAVHHADRMTVARIEELEVVAARFAEAFVTGRPVRETARLGTVTTAEAAPDIRREGESGFGFALGGVAPVGGGYGEAGMGLLIDFSYWFEARWFAIGPRIGVRFSAGLEEDRSYVVVPIDVTGYYILSLGEVAPFVGGGVGVRYAREERPATITVGNVIPMTHDKQLKEGAWGFGAFGRVGLLFLRTYAVRLMLWADYDVTFVELNGERLPQAVTFGLGLIF